MSLGVVEFRVGETAKGFVARADQAMYKAKQSGRNRMVVAGEVEEVIEFTG